MNQKKLSVWLKGIVIGIGFCVTGVLKLFTEGALSWAGLIAGLAAGLPFIHKAQKGLNGSWF